MTDDRDARVERLRTAAKKKQDAARERAQRGLEALLQAHEPVTFRAVARAGPVSIDFLYREPELRARIEDLRAAEHATEPDATPPRSTVVHALTQHLRALRTENADLRRRLEAAHGEIVRLKRTTGGRAATAGEEAMVAQSK